MKFGLAIYRLAAKVMACALNYHSIVESVYVARGVGRGEIAFGRSDIDLMTVVRTPNPGTGDGAELASLYRRVKVLRRLNPAIQHMMVHDPQGLDRWNRTDSYLSSTERRSFILLAGKSNPIPNIPVRREDAIRWFAHWSKKLFPIALRSRKSRHVRKICMEIWRAWVVANGIAAEPTLTQEEAYASARAHPAGAELLNLDGEPQPAVEFFMRLAGLMHDALLPQLRPLRKTLITRVLMPPLHSQRTMIILPRCESPLPPEVFDPQSFIATPELLHLYMYYANPFMNWFLPQELKDLGFLTPPPRQFVRACMFFGQDNNMRRPGFLVPYSYTPGTTVAINRHCLPYLRNGEVPPPMPADLLQAALTHELSNSDFYLQDFGKVYREALEQLRIFEGLERAAPETRRLSMR